MSYLGLSCERPHNMNYVLPSIDLGLFIVKVHSQICLISRTS